MSNQAVSRRFVGAQRASFVVISFFLATSVTASAAPRCESVFAWKTVEANPKKDRGFFESAERRGVRLKVRQKLALLQLSKLAGEVDRELAATASEKLAAYESEPLVPELLADFARLGASEATRSSIEVILKTFQSTGDEALRSAAIAKLGRDSASDMATIESLLPIVRGSEGVGAKEYRQAGRAVRDICARLPEGFRLTERNFERPKHEGSLRKKLADAKVISIKPISSGNNVNSTLVVLLELPSGEQVRGVFKAFLGENTLGKVSRDNVLFTREVQASDFYAEYFPNERIYVPETLEVVLNHEGIAYGVGSFQLFAEGMTTVNSYYRRGKPVATWQEYGRVWKHQVKDDRWAGVEPWVRTVDWILGNADRFPNSRYGAGNPNNIMMKEVETKKGKTKIEVALIDNGSGRRDRGTQYGPNDLPPAWQIPKALRKILRKHSDKDIAEIAERFRGDLSENGVKDLVSRLRVARDRVRQQIFEDESDDGDGATLLLESPASEKAF